MPISSLILLKYSRHTGSQYDDYILDGQRSLRKNSPTQNNLTASTEVFSIEETVVRFFGDLQPQLLRSVVSD